MAARQEVICIMLRQVYYCRLSYSDPLLLNQFITQMSSRDRVDPIPDLIHVRHTNHSGYVYCERTIWEGEKDG